MKVSCVEIEQMLMYQKKNLSSFQVYNSIFRRNCTKVTYWKAKEKIFLILDIAYFYLMKNIDTHISKDSKVSCVAKVRKIMYQY